MSKWEDSFKKTIQYGDENNPCRCMSNQGLFIPNRQLSAIIAALLFVLFCIFISGYFLGKKYAAEQFTAVIRQDSFADHIYTSVLSATEQAENNNDLLATAGHITTTTPEPLVAQEPIASLSDLSDVTQNYYAQLIGFGTEKAAQQFVLKLAAKGTVTEVKKRASKTVKGKTSYWYQVVTPAYADKYELSTLVDKIAKEENLKDVCIKVC